MAESAGIMSGAFFVGKSEILKWINDFFKVNYTKIEDTATGAIHCQIMHSIYPDAVPMHKVSAPRDREADLALLHAVAPPTPRACPGLRPRPPARRGATRRGDTCVSRGWS
jgi:hypothetical protein